MTTPPVSGLLDHSSPFYGDYLEHRFGPVREYLPARGTVKFVTEIEESLDLDYVLAQYHLAPLVLDWRSLERAGEGYIHTFEANKGPRFEARTAETDPLVLGSFSDSDRIGEFAEQNGLRTVMVFEGGVALFKGKSR